MDVKNEALTTRLVSKALPQPSFPAVYFDGLQHLVLNEEIWLQWTSKPVEQLLPATTSLKATKVKYQIFRRNGMPTQAS